jgi:putative ABC transport system permease protein
MTDNAPDENQHGTDGRTSSGLPSSGLRPPASPPRWADKLLEWCCPPRLLEDVQGDLQEVFMRQAREQGLGKARRAYFRAMLAYVRPFYLSRKPKPYPKPLFTDMLRNYFILAFRNLVKHKTFSVINISGLTISLVACLMIGLYVRHELSYDTFHSNHKRIYRLVTDVKTPAETINLSITSGPMAAGLKGAFPEVEAVVRVLKNNLLVKVGEKPFQENNVFFADSTLFDVFSFRLLQGNPRTALAAPFSIVLTESTARKYFGTADALGKTLLMEGTATTVTGVVGDVPANSHLQFDLLASMSTFTQVYAPGIDKGWDDFSFYSYLLLREKADPARLAAKFPGFLERHMGQLMRDENRQYSLLLEPLGDVYLRSKRSQELEGGSLGNVYLFAIIAGFILLIACTNFVNLIIARSSERAREVGMRKVIGALRRQLTFQFLGETFLQAFIAFLLAVVLCRLLLPAFETLAGKQIASDLLQDRTYWLGVAGLLLLVSVSAGLYPALVLSRFKPIAMLKGRFTSAREGAVLRKALVVVQFVISVGLIIGTTVVYKQLNYMRSQELGFQKDQMLLLRLHSGEDMRRRLEILRREFTALPGVKSVAFSSHIPGESSKTATFDIQNPAGQMQPANVGLYYVDFNFLDQYGIKPVAGRVFSSLFATDSTQAMVVNEAAVEALGYASLEAIIGKRFAHNGRQGTIIGVIKDFHQTSLKHKIAPLTLQAVPDHHPRFISISIKGNSSVATLTAAEEVWKKFLPHRPFEYSFLDETFDRQYRAEEHFGMLFLCFAGLAIFIACLGLLALSAYAASQRTKEIGVRKVLGASAASIAALLSREFIQLVGIAILIATPIAGYAMNQWLQDFEFRTQISWWTFVAAGLGALGIALLTVSFQAIKAALANPVKSLRNE